ncbi:unnamed protein product [Timema podura]|uniref:Uncharacterized protein n=1 Tax=Timema podura TaxID=61482 RepID=A0ABN7NY87_TIMPD|nr:unnamed protein product [Timema podura]
MTSKVIRLLQKKKTQENYQIITWIPFNKTDSKSKEREYLDSDMESDEGDYHGSDDIDIPFSTLADIVGEDLKVAEEMRNARTLCEMSDSNIVDEELSKKTTDSFTDPLSESELLKDIEEITVNEDGEEISTVENESSGVEPNISTSVSPVASGSSLPVPSKNDRLMDFIMKNTLPTYTADISGFPVPSLLSLQRCVGCNDSEGSNPEPFLMNRPGL